MHKIKISIVLGLLLSILSSLYSITLKGQAIHGGVILCANCFNCECCGRVLQDMDGYNPPMKTIDQVGFTNGFFSSKFEQNARYCKLCGDEMENGGCKCCHHIYHKCKKEPRYYQKEEEPHRRLKNEDDPPVYFPMKPGLRWEPIIDKPYLKPFDKPEKVDKPTREPIEHHFGRNRDY